MKVSALIPLLLSSAVFATRRSDILSTRQAHIQRSLLDVCVALDVDVAVLPGPAPLLVGHLDLCLCLSVLPDFTLSNPIGKTVATLLGSDGAHNYFTNLIQSQSNKQECHYPDHAHPFCDKSNPCDFTCDDGFTPNFPTNPTQCICQAPLTVCNGRCGTFPNGCGSQLPARNVRRSSPPTCAAGKTLCGVPGGSNGKGYECVNTDTDKESCGGCVAQSPFGGASPSGTNCRQIEHVKDVECDGSCRVISCEDGYEPSEDLLICILVDLQVQIAKRDEVDDILALLLKQGLLVEIPDVLALKEALGLFAIVGRSYDSSWVDPILVLLLKQGLIVGISDLLSLKEALGLVAIVGRSTDDINTPDDLLNLLLRQGLIVGIPDLLGLKEALGLDLSVLRRDATDDLLTLLLKQGLIVGITNLLDLKEALGLGLTVL